VSVAGQAARGISGASALTRRGRPQAGRARGAQPAARSQCIDPGALAGEGNGLSTVCRAPWCALGLSVAWDRSGSAVFSLVLAAPLVVLLSQRWLADALIEAINNFRGGTPTATHPSRPGEHGNGPASPVAASRATAPLSTLLKLHSVS
jgi:hypothetical protein